jgi:hypothetical protein
MGQSTNAERSAKYTGRSSFGSAAPPAASGRAGGFAIAPTLVRRRLTTSIGSSGALKPYVRSCSAWKRSSSPSPDGIVSS